MLMPVLPAASMEPPPPRPRPGLGLRLWRVIGSPWCTFSLLALMALVGILSLLLPQAETASSPVQGQWLATLQGRYGRWTGLLSSLGLFDIAHALWFQVLLVLVAYQSTVAIGEGCDKAWRWLRPGVVPAPQSPPAQIWKRGEMSLPLSLEQGVSQVQSALQRLDYQVVATQDGGEALLEAMRHPWLTLGRPLAHGGLVLACVAVLLSGRLDWQEGLVTLSPGQSYELRHMVGAVLHMDKAGLARSSSRLYSWISLMRDGQVWCTGIASLDRALNCEGVHIRQGSTEPALHIGGYDRTGHPLAIQSLRGEEGDASGITLAMPSYLPDRYAVLPERGLMFHVEASSARGDSPLRLEVYRGQQSVPLLEQDIVGPISLALDDVTFNFNPTRVPALRVYHTPTRPLRWMGLGLACAGLLASLALLPFHVWVEIGEQEGEGCLRLYQSFPLPLCVPTIQEIESRMGASSAREAEL